MPHDVKNTKVMIVQMYKEAKKGKNTECKNLIAQ